MMTKKNERKDALGIPACSKVAAAKKLNNNGSLSCPQA